MEELPELITNNFIFSKSSFDILLNIFPISWAIAC